jgi:hypothetical protein
MRVCGIVRSAVRMSPEGLSPGGNLLADKGLCLQGSRRGHSSRRQAAGEVFVVKVPVAELVGILEDPVAVLDGG